MMNKRMDGLQKPQKARESSMEPITSRAESGGALNTPRSQPGKTLIQVTFRTGVSALVRGRISGRQALTNVDRQRRRAPASQKRVELPPEQGGGGRLGLAPGVDQRSAA